MLFQRSMRTSPTLLLLAACATTPAPRPQQPPGSRGLRASEHIDAARDQDQLARERAAYPDSFVGDGTGRNDQILIATPWHRSWDTAEDHERLAAYHRSQAAQIHDEFEAACAGRAEAEIRVSPLVRYGVGDSPTTDGVTIFLAPEAGNPDKLMADMRCHRAWMMLQPPANMDDCPLDLAGLTVEANGAKEGISVTLRVKDAALVPELQRRAAHDLEQGHELRTSSPAR
jgi:hypothetical protein